MSVFTIRSIEASIERLNAKERQEQQRAKNKRLTIHKSTTKSVSSIKSRLGAGGRDQTAPLSPPNTPSFNPLTSTGESFSTTSTFTFKATRITSPGAISSNNAKDNKGSAGAKKAFVTAGMPSTNVVNQGKAAGENSSPAKRRASSKLWPSGISFSFPFRRSSFRADADEHSTVWKRDKHAHTACPWLLALTFLILSSFSHPRTHATHTHPQTEPPKHKHPFVFDPLASFATKDGGVMERFTVRYAEQVGAADLQLPASAKEGGERETERRRPRKKGAEMRGDVIQEVASPPMSPPRSPEPRNGVIKA